MRTVKLSSPEPAIDYIVKTLRQHLEAGERVLWLVTGGSSIALEAVMSHKLSGVPLDKLSVTLTDERPGPVGHADSNLKQLADAGFKLPGATVQPVLTGAGSAAEAAALDRWLAGQLDSANFRFAVFSVGSDGHIAGIPAADSQTPKGALYASYDKPNFRRLSVTPAVFGRLDEAVVFITGDAKQEQFERFETDLPVSQQAAQAAKAAPNLIVFNSFKGDPE